MRRKTAAGALCLLAMTIGCGGGGGGTGGGPTGGYALTRLNENPDFQNTATDISASGLVVGSEPGVYYPNGRRTLLPTLGGQDATANAVNNRGQIVGSSTVDTDSSARRAFVFDAGRIDALPSPTGRDGDNSEAFDINDGGQIVGAANVASEANGFRFNAILWQQGRVVILGSLPGRSWSIARAINNAGQVVGESFQPVGGMGGGGSAPLPMGLPSHAFVWRNGRMTDLGTLPGGHSSAAWAVNDRGWIVGAADTADGTQHAVLWRDGTIRDLGTLGGKTSLAVSINNAGQIVGESDLAAPDRIGNTTHAFVYRDGRMRDLNALSGTLASGNLLASASAINDRGWIVGPRFQGIAILLTPR